MGKGWREMGWGRWPGGGRLLNYLSCDEGGRISKGRGEGKGL